MSRPRDADSAPSALRKWRGKQRLHELSERAEVDSGVWANWEAGRTRPSLANAIRLELITNGRVRVEAWGYDGEVLNDAARVMRQRAAALALLDLDREEFWESFR